MSYLIFVTYAVILVTSSAVSAPSSVTVRSRGARSVTLSWSYDSDAASLTGFNIQVNKTATGSVYAVFDPVFDKSRTEHNATIASLTPSTSYAFAVQAVTASSSGLFSDAVQISTSFDVPSAPYNLALVRKDGFSITINWSIPFDGGSPIGGYQVLVGADDASGLVAHRNVSKNLVQYSNLQPSLYFRVQVQAYNLRGFGSLSNVFRDRTAAVPSRPTPVSLVSCTSSSITVAMVAPASNDAAISEYFVLYDPDGAGYRAAPCSVGSSGCLGPGRTASTLFTAVGLTSFTRYPFVLIARNSVGNSSRSDYVALRTAPAVPDAPSEPWAGEPLNADAVTIQWHLPLRTNGASIDYSQVYVAASELGVAQLAGVAYGSNTSLYVSGLDAATAYLFKVRVANSVGFSDFSNTSTIVTRGTVAEVPHSVVQSAVDLHSMSVSWTQPASASQRVDYWNVTFGLVTATSNCSSVAAATVYMSFESLLGAAVELAHLPTYDPFNHTTYTPSNLTAGSCWYFSVAAVNDVGSSAFTPVYLFSTALDTPGPPQNLHSANMSTTTCISMLWDACTTTGGSSVMQYELQADDGFAGPFEVVCLVSCSSFPCGCTATLDRPNVYRFRVRGINTVGAGTFSDVVTSSTSMQGESSSDFRHHGLHLSGSAAVDTSTGALVLTNGSRNVAGSAFLPQLYGVARGFDIMFKLQLQRSADTCQFHMLEGGDDTFCSFRGGHGMALVLIGHVNGTDLLSSGAPLGAGGSGLGYDGIPNSIALELDTWHDIERGDTYNNHVSVQTCGSAPNSAHHNFSLGATSDIPNMADAQQHLVRVRYVPDAPQQLLAAMSTTCVLQVSPYAAQSLPLSTTYGAIYVFVDDIHNPSLLIPVHLPALLQLDDNKAYVGLTAATGDPAQSHTVSWLYVSVTTQ